MVNKGLAKLRNIVAETMFLVMFPGVDKLGNICFGRKICVREAKMFWFLTPGKNFCCFRAEICLKTENYDVDVEDRFVFRFSV